MSAETLETPRLRRPLVVGDASRMAELANDKDVARMTTRIPHPFSLQDAQAFLAHCETGEETVFAIDHHGSGLIGVIGFRTFGPVGPEVGYWLGRPYWGQGLATEAAKTPWSGPSATGAGAASSAATSQTTLPRAPC